MASVATTTNTRPAEKESGCNLKQLGKVTTGRSCIYIKRLEDIQMPTLEKMVKQAMVDIKRYTNPGGTA